MLLRAKEIGNKVIVENAVILFDTLVCSIRPTFICILLNCMDFEWLDL